MSAEPTADILDLGLARLVHLDQRVDAGEDDALRARWEFGRELLAKREGKQLPRGLMAQLCEQTGKSRQELNHRMKFAERFPTEAEVSDAIRDFRSWFQVVHRALSPSAAVADVEIDPDALPLPEGVFRVPGWNPGRVSLVEVPERVPNLRQYSGGRDRRSGERYAADLAAETARTLRCSPHWQAGRPLADHRESCDCPATLAGCTERRALRSIADLGSRSGVPAHGGRWPTKGAS